MSISNLCLRDSIYFANRWFSRSHKTINSLLMEVLRIAKHVDELGLGKKLIFSESIRHGKQMPEVLMEPAGRYKRWKLLLYGGIKNEFNLKLLNRIREVYKPNEQKSLIAFALVLWRDKKVQDIKKYIDGDFSRQFAEIITSYEGPIFYNEQKDKISLRRWAEILLGEGLYSKDFSLGEEKIIKEVAYTLCKKFYEGKITPEELRSFAQMGNTSQEQSLSSKILSKWCKEGLLKKISKGKYRWIKKPKDYDSSDIVQDLLKYLEN